MKTLTNIKHQAGMTLIEIMIALLIGAFLIGGILQIFTSSKQTYRMQEGLSRLQENGRFAMEFITHDIRMAGYWGCFANGLGGITNKLNFDATDPDEDAAFGYASDIEGNQGVVDPGGNDALDASDDITIRGASGSGILLTTASANTSAALTATAHGFSADDLIYVTDCNNADIFQASSVPDADTITHTTAGSTTVGTTVVTLGNSDGTLSTSYNTDAQIYKVSTIVYSIQAGAGGQNSLFKKIDATAATELVEGIENIQILYGEDTDANRTPDYYVPIDSVVNMNNVVSIRVSLLLTTDDNLASQPLAFTYNGATTTPADRRIRRVFTSTIAVRNRLP